MRHHRFNDRRSDSTSTSVENPGDPPRRVARRKFGRGAAGGGRGTGLRGILNL
eukprot:SAG31_NODE_31670_length_365_cov_1.154135_1_plen_52_part_01